MSIIIKTPEQIEKIRKSCRLAASALNHIVPYVKEGVTTDELNGTLEEYIRRHGATPAPLGYKGYPKATCISLNEVVCHGIPDGRKLVDGDILNIDVTTVLDGYYGDTSRMFTVGTTSYDALSLMKITLECLHLGIEEVKPGSHVGNIGHAIQTHAHKFKYGVVESFCGHGVGLDFHEPPHIPHFGKRGTGPTLQPGMIFTIEPMLNIGGFEVVVNKEDGWTVVTGDGSLSAQYEHTVLVTKSGVEILTLS